MFKLLNQPRGFSVFFLSELFERYGFYITQTLLIFYLIKHFHLTDSASYNILGSFTALAYVNPILGGYIADRYLGARLAILSGALLISLGFTILIFAGSIFISLAIIAVGSGLFKPNITSLLGSLYASNDPRRHTGYTIFYMGTNFGIILATTLGGYLQQAIGWRITYATAAIVLLITCVTFLLGSRFFHFADRPYVKHSLKKHSLAFFIIAAAAVMNSIILEHQMLAVIAFGLAAFLSVAVIFYEIFRSKDKREKRDLTAYLLLAGICVFFWTIYFQLFFSMNLFIDRAVDRNMFGFIIPPSFFVSIVCFGIIIFGPVLGALWHFFALKGREISIPGKFTMGLCAMTIAFALLIMSFLFTNNQGLVMAGGIIAVYLVISVGELMISPIGLAMANQLAPSRLAGLMMGIYFVSLGLGGKLASVFASFAAISPNIVNPDQVKNIYHRAFFIYLIACLILTIISFSLVRVIKKLISENTP